MLVSHVQRDQCNWCVQHGGMDDTLSFRVGHVNQNSEIKPVPYQTKSGRALLKPKFALFNPYTPEKTRQKLVSIFEN